MYWNSIPIFDAFLHFQYHSCEEIVYFSRDYSTTFIQYMLHTEVTANQLKSNRCFLCARLKSMYWKSISTFGAHLQFQYHSCEVYFSRDFSTTFIQYMQHTEVTANQLKSNRCFLCARLKSMYWNSIHFWGTSSISVPQLWRDSLLFNFSTTFIQLLPKSRRTRSHFLQFLKSMYSIHFWGTSSISVQLWRLKFSTYTFQGILVLLSFNISYIPKSRQTSWSQTDAFFVQDWNRCTENQYPLLGHFFNFSTTAVKR